jgi:hypothetical protein
MRRWHRRAATRAVSPQDADDFAPLGVLQLDDVVVELDRGQQLDKGRPEPELPWMSPAAAFARPSAAARSGRFAW